MTNTNFDRPLPGTKRVASVDLLRGIVMIVMALDHTRDFFSKLRIQPEDLTKSTAPLFFTRWITHFCAPTFFFLAGMGASLALRGGRSKKDVSIFLLTRGLWLVLLELTIFQFIWNFEFAWPVYLLVIWALGWSMVFLAGVMFLPRTAVAAIGLTMIFGHNLLDGIAPASFGSLAPLWNFLHVPGFLVPGKALVGYQLIPWSGVMFTGFALGAVFDWEPAKRRRFLLQVGIAATIAFIVIRYLNGYGDARHWSVQGSAIMTLASFLNTVKYPPSMLFLLMTLGPSMIALALLENVRNGVADIISVYGKVPMFYFLVHILVIHLLATGFALLQGGQAAFLGLDLSRYPPWYGTSLPGVYLAWTIVVVILYLPCRWFADLKARRRDWWLGYL